MEEKIEINKKTVASSLTWKLLERICSQGINLIVQVLLARLLLPEDFGSLAIIVSVTNYATLFIQSGLSTAIVQKEDLDRTDISTLFTSSIALALIFYILLFCLSPFIASYYKVPILKQALRVLALILFLNAINSIQIALLSRKMKFKNLFSRSLISVPISGALGIGMALLGYGIWALIVQILSNTLITVIVLAIASKEKIRFGFSPNRARQLYSFSIKILLTNLINGFYDMLRTLIIGKRYSSNDLAYYDKAYTYSAYISQIANASISSVLLSTFSRKQSDIVALKNMARRSTQLTSFLMFPLLVGVAAVAEPLVELLLSDKWLPCVPFLVVFCFLRIPDAIKTIDVQVYYSVGRSGIYMVYSSSCCVLNVIVLILVMHFGTLFIAIGALIVEYVSMVVVFLISRKFYGYTLWERIQDLLKPAISSSCMFFLIKAIQQFEIKLLLSLLLQIIVGVISYFCISLLIRDKSIPYVISIINSFRSGREKQ